VLCHYMVSDSEFKMDKLNREDCVLSEMYVCRARAQTVHLIKINFDM